MAKQPKGAEHAAEMFNLLLGGMNVQKIKRETAAQRSNPTAAEKLQESLHPKQLRLLKDPARKVAVLCPRRAGKSYVVTAMAVIECLTKPGQIWVIGALTRPNAKNIYWSALRHLDSEMNLGCLFNAAELRIDFPNGSTLWLKGAKHREEAEKFRGQQFDGVILDEAGSHNPVVLTEVINDIITPALGDRLGRLILIGTPGHFLAGPFYESTCEPPVKKQAADGSIFYSNCMIEAQPEMVKEFTWSLHTWTTEDNVSKAGRNAWATAVKEKRMNGWADDHPTWRREYLAHWVAHSSILVYSVKPAVHTWQGPIPGERGYDNPDDLTYVAGADFGHKDGTTYVIWVYSRFSRDLWEVSSSKIYGSTVPEMATAIQMAEAVLPKPPMIRVGDPGGGGLTIMHTLATEHGLAFKVAEKTQKNNFIELMNKNLNENIIHFRPGSQLLEEMVENQWEERTLGTGRLVESRKTPNDLCDAALYAFRECWHRMGKEEAIESAVVEVQPAWARKPTGAENMKTWAPVKWERI